MAVTKRHYRPEDAQLISDFLIRHHVPGNRDGNWLQPTWEYALTHPALDEHSLGAMTVWEDEGEIAAVVNYEHKLGEAFFQVHPGHTDLKPAMLDCAEVNLRAGNDDGHVELKAYVNDFDAELESIVSSRGYVRLPAADRPLSRLDVDVAPKPAPVPPGFQIRSLAEDNNLKEMDRVLWRGFGHEGDPPEDSVDGRRKMQSGPGYRADLAIVSVSPAGHFAAFCGMWYVPDNGFAYVEPVAADPEFRRMGLGRAVVTEGVRRCAKEGASVVYVGSDMDFYKSLGFNKTHTANCWVKRFNR